MLGKLFGDIPADNALAGPIAGRLCLPQHRVIDWLNYQRISAGMPATTIEVSSNHKSTQPSSNREEIGPCLACPAPQAPSGLLDRTGCKTEEEHSTPIATRQKAWRKRALPESTDALDATSRADSSFPLATTPSGPNRFKSEPARGDPSPPSKRIKPEDPTTLDKERLHLVQGQRQASATTSPELTSAGSLAPPRIPRETRPPLVAPGVPKLKFLKFQLREENPLPSTKRIKLEEMVELDYQQMLEEQRVNYELEHLGFAAVDNPHK